MRAIRAQLKLLSDKKAHREAAAENTSSGPPDDRDRDQGGGPSGSRNDDDANGPSNGGSGGQRPKPSLRMPVYDGPLCKKYRGNTASAPVGGASSKHPSTSASETYGGSTWEEATGDVIAGQGTCWKPGNNSDAAGNKSSISLTNISDGNTTARTSGAATTSSNSDNPSLLDLFKELDVWEELYIPQKPKLTTPPPQPPHTLPLGLPLPPHVQLHHSVAASQPFIAARLAAASPGYPSAGGPQNMMVAGPGGMGPRVNWHLRPTMMNQQQRPGPSGMLLRHPTALLQPMPPQQLSADGMPVNPNHHPQMFQQIPVMDVPGMASPYQQRLLQHPQRMIGQQQQQASSQQLWPSVSSSSSPAAPSTVVGVSGGTQQPVQSPIPPSRPAPLPLRSPGGVKAGRTSSATSDTFGELDTLAQLGQAIAEQVPGSCDGGGNNSAFNTPSAEGPPGTPFFHPSLPTGSSFPGIPPHTSSHPSTPIMPAPVATGERKSSIDNVIDNVVMSIGASSAAAVAAGSQHNTAASAVSAAAVVSSTTLQQQQRPMGSTTPPHQYICTSAGSTLVGPPPQAHTPIGSANCSGGLVAHPPTPSTPASSTPGSVPGPQLLEASPAGNMSGSGGSGVNVTEGRGSGPMCATPVTPNSQQGGLAQMLQQHQPVQAGGLPSSRSLDYDILTYADRERPGNDEFDFEKSEPTEAQLIDRRLHAGGQQHQRSYSIPGAIAPGGGPLFASGQPVGEQLPPQNVPPCMATASASSAAHLHAVVGATSSQMLHQSFPTGGRQRGVQRVRRPRGRSPISAADRGGGVGFIGAQPVSGRGSRGGGRGRGRGSRNSRNSAPPFSAPANEDGSPRLTLKMRHATPQPPPSISAPYQMQPQFHQICVSGSGPVNTNGNTYHNIPAVMPPHLQTTADHGTAATCLPLDGRNKGFQAPTNIGLPTAPSQTSSSPSLPASVPSTSIFPPKPVSSSPILQSIAAMTPPVGVSSLGTNSTTALPPAFDGTMPYAASMASCNSGQRSSVSADSEPPVVPSSHQAAGSLNMSFDFSSAATPRFNASIDSSVTVLPPILLPPHGFASKPLEERTLNHPQPQQQSGPRPSSTPLDTVVNTSPHLTAARTSADIICSQQQQLQFTKNIGGGQSTPTGNLSTNLGSSQTYSTTAKPAYDHGAGSSSVTQPPGHEISDSDETVTGEKRHQLQASGQKTDAAPQSEDNHGRRQPPQNLSELLNTQHVTQDTAAPVPQVIPSIAPQQTQIDVQIREVLGQMDHSSVANSSFPSLPTPTTAPRSTGNVTSCSDMTPTSGVGPNLFENFARPSSGGSQLIECLKSAPIQFSNQLAGSGITPPSDASSFASLHGRGGGKPVSGNRRRESLNNLIDKLMVKQYGGAGGPIDGEDCMGHHDEGTDDDRIDQQPSTIGHLPHELMGQESIHGVAMETFTPALTPSASSHPLLVKELESTTNTTAATPRMVCNTVDSSFSSASSSILGNNGRSEDRIKVVIKLQGANKTAKSKSGSGSGEVRSATIVGGTDHNPNRSGNSAGSGSGVGHMGTSESGRLKVKKKAGSSVKKTKVPRPATSFEAAGTPVGAGVLSDGVACVTQHITDQQTLDRSQVQRETVAVAAKKRKPSLPDGRRPNKADRLATRALSSDNSSSLVEAQLKATSIASKSSCGGADMRQPVLSLPKITSSRATTVSEQPRPAATATKQAGLSAMPDATSVSLEKPISAAAFSVAKLALQIGTNPTASDMFGAVSTNALKNFKIPKIDDATFRPSNPMTDSTSSSSTAGSGTTTATSFTKESGPKQAPTVFPCSSDAVSAHQRRNTSGNTTVNRVDSSNGGSTAGNPTNAVNLTGSGSVIPRGFDSAPTATTSSSVTSSNNSKPAPRPLLKMNLPTPNAIAVGSSSQSDGNSGPQPLIPSGSTVGGENEGCLSSQSPRALLAALRNKAPLLPSPLLGHTSSGNGGASGASGSGSTVAGTVEDGIALKGLLSQPSLALSHLGTAGVHPHHWRQPTLAPSNPSPSGRYPISCGPNGGGEQQTAVASSGIFPASINSSTVCHSQPSPHFGNLHQLGLGSTGVGALPMLNRMPPFPVTNHPPIHLGATHHVGHGVGGTSFPRHRATHRLGLNGSQQSGAVAGMDGLGSTCVGNTSLLVRGGGSTSKVGVGGGVKSNQPAAVPASPEEDTLVIDDDATDGSNSGPSNGCSGAGTSKTASPLNTSSVSLTSGETAVPQTSTQQQTPPQDAPLSLTTRVISSQSAAVSRDSPARLDDGLMDEALGISE